MKLSERMKKYESVQKQFLMAKTPAIIRLDGKAFHTWTRNLEKPFDANFYAAMAQTTVNLVNSIQGAVFAYGQSDEISIFIKDYTNFDTDAWFGGNIQKIVSVSASIATANFNSYAERLGISNNNLALFDSRVFTLPPHEVSNYFIWRQEDFHRNSVRMVAHEYLGHKACEHRNSQDLVNDLRNMDTPIDWYRDYEDVYRRGYCFIRGADSVNVNVPVFKECLDFINVHVQSSFYSEDTEATP